MGKHRQPSLPKNRTKLAAAAAAAGVTSTLVLGHATGVTAENVDVKLAATVIAVGGRGDTLSERVQPKLKGNYALGFANNPTPIRIEYPASFQFQQSIDDGVPKLTNAIPGNGQVRIVSYSEGTLVAEQVKRNFTNNPTAPGTPSPADLDFVFIASPYVPNGGIFARFPGFQIPGLLPVFSAAASSPYNSTYVTNEYDGFADFPAYFNPLSIANAVAGMIYAHPDQYYDGIDLNDPKTVKYTKDVVDPKTGSTTTYTLVYNPHLPILAPIRQIATLTGLTPLTEPGLEAIEPGLRAIIDAGYTDRTNANPGTPTAFSFFTPPAKIAATANALPKAATDGAAAATNGDSQPAPAPAAKAKIAPEQNVVSALPKDGTDLKQDKQDDADLKQDSKDAKDLKDSKDQKDVKDLKDSKDLKDTKADGSYVGKHRLPTGRHLLDALKVKPPTGTTRTTPKPADKEKDSAPAASSPKPSGDHESKPAA